jgi:hypothetical protein
MVRIGRFLAATRAASLMCVFQQGCVEQAERNGKTGCDGTYDLTKLL